MKYCNWDCVYCQLGRSRPMVNLRNAYFNPQEIFSQVRDALDAHKPGQIDWVPLWVPVTPGLGEMVRIVKAMAVLPVAVITNGSLHYLSAVREALLPVDAVLPSLDAGNPDLYRRNNCSHPDLTFERLVDGLISFREAYAHQLWVEVMLIKGMNDGREALEEIAAFLNRSALMMSIL